MMLSSFQALAVLYVCQTVDDCMYSLVMSPLILCKFLCQALSTSHVHNSLAASGFVICTCRDTKMHIFSNVKLLK